MDEKRLQRLFENIADDYGAGLVRREEDRNGRMILSFFNELDVLRKTVELEFTGGWVSHHTKSTEFLVAVYSDDGSPVYISHDSISAIIAVALR
jgi:hypothetical protein